VALMLSGWLLALAGFHWHTLLASAGIALVASGWSIFVPEVPRLVASKPDG